MKKVLVTGGSSGIGKSICEHLTSKGYEVLGTSRNPEKITNSKIDLAPLDVTSEESIENLCVLIKKKWGGLDILINNAGIGFMGPLELAKSDQIRNAWETNVFGLMKITQTMLPLLKESGSGRVINIGSIGGKMGLPYRGWYSAAKGSLEILSESLALELKPFEIQVCTLLPGDVQTPIGESRLEPDTNDLGDYKDSYNRMKMVLDKEMSNAIPASHVAKAVHTLLRKKRMPLKYCVGSFLHKLTPIIKNLTSQRFFQTLILRHYKQN